MRGKEDAPVAAGARMSAEKAKHERKLSKPAAKIHRILKAFANGERLNFIDAQRKHHDRSLHSTVSEIQSRLGIDVKRSWEMVPSFMGEPTRCRRYWLEPEQRDKALLILGVIA